MEPGSITDRHALLESFFSGRRFALILAIVVFACFAPVILGFQSFVYRDFGLFQHPLAHYSRESFWRGEIPLWNPFNNCGLPFMAQWNTLVFYPPTIIYLLLPTPWSLCLFCVLHLYFGGLGMFFLARRWTESSFAAAFAGTVFAFNGLVLHCLMWTNNCAALAWMPWILLFVDRACRKGGWYLLPAIVAGSFQFLTGAPEAFLLTWVGAAVLWLAQAFSNRAALVQYVMRFIVIVLGIVLLTAVQSLPLLELIKASQRSAGFETGGWSMPPWGWANLLVPRFRTTPGAAGAAFQLGQGWTSSYYFGIATVWLALFAMVRVRKARVRALTFLVVLGLVMALGNAGLVWPWLKSHVPALGFMRYPIKLVFLIACPLTLLAAFGLADIVRTPAGQWPRTLRIAASIGALLLITIVLVCWFGRAFPMQDEDAWAALLSGITRAGFLILLAVGLWTLRHAPGQRFIAVACLWLGIVFADLITHTAWQNPTIKTSLLSADLPQLADLRHDLPPEKGRVMLSLPALQMFRYLPLTNLSERYMASRMGLSHTLNLLDGIAKCDGFFSLYIGKQQDVQFRLFQDENSLHRPIADALGVAYVTAPGKLFEWSARTNYVPTISIGQQPLFTPAEQQLDAMTKDTFDPHGVVLLPMDAQKIITATRQPLAKVTVERYQPQQIELKANAPASTMLTISQSHYAPWKAYVDGTPVPLWRANHAFQAVEIPAGEHQVRLRYEDRMFHIGALISGLALLPILIGAAFPSGRRAFTLAEQ
jgi:hypothetical protein